MWGFLEFALKLDATNSHDANKIETELLNIAIEYHYQHNNALIK